MAASGKNGPKHGGASQRVLEYLRRTPNMTVPYSEIREALGYPAYTVSNAVNHLLTKNVGVVRPMWGVAMVTTPGRNDSEEIMLDRAEIAPERIPYHPASRKLYEFVGNSGGITIVRGEDDELYGIRPLVELL